MFPHAPFTNQNSRGAVSAVLRVRVSDAASASDLVAFLAGTAYEAMQIAPDRLAVRAPSALAEELARAELEIYLRIWQRRRPGVGAEVSL